jgi:hypothetical protein
MVENLSHKYKVLSADPTTIKRKKNKQSRTVDLHAGSF